MTTFYLGIFDGTFGGFLRSDWAKPCKVTYAHYGLAFDEQWIMDFIIKESVKALLYQVAKEQELDFYGAISFL